MSTDQKTMQQNKCVFCGSPTNSFASYQVCRNCETVAFTKDISPKEKAEAVLTFFNGIDKRLLDKEDLLHDIDQKALNGEILSSEEQLICDSLTEFHSIRIELEKCISNESSLNSKRVRNLLYELLMLSEWLNHFTL